MLIASLQTRVRQRKQMLYNQQTDNKMFYIYTVVDYLELKENEVMTFTGTRTDHSEKVNQTRRQMIHVLSYWRLQVPNLQMQIHSL